MQKLVSIVAFINIDLISLELKISKKVNSCFVLVLSSADFFQISGFLLLLAMIGAIVLAHSDLKNPKSISPINQKNVDKKTIIKLN